jgi:hypothetical protein
MAEFAAGQTSMHPQSRHAVCAALLTVALGSNAVCAQTSANADAPEPGAEAHAQDKSGTNPANFSKTLQLRSEYYSIDGDSYGSRTQAIYSMPSGKKSKFELEAPFLVGTDLFGANLFGFGDVSVSWKTRPYLSRKMAVVAGVEVFTPSGSRDELSANRWSVGPTVTVALFYPKARLIFAPTYQQQVSVTDSSLPANFDPGGGDTSTGGAPASPVATPGDINKGTFDLYLVYRFADNKRWITIDPAITIDYENDSEVTTSIAPAYGFFVRPGGSVSIQPVIPLKNEFLDWGVKVTLKQVF